MKSIWTTIKKIWVKIFGVRKPEIDKHWTIIYYGPRGSCKTLHQGKETIHVLVYLEWLYLKWPNLPRAIVMTNQKFNAQIEGLYLNKDLFYWEDVKDFHYCPRKGCWKGPEKHRLHNAYLIFDDISTILPPDSWQNTPLWLRKTFSQARHNGVRCLANLQDPNAVDINFRRYCDLAFKFSKLIGSRDPDEAKPPVKYIFGIYRRRKIEAEMLWKYGNLPEQQIRLALMDKERLEEELKRQGHALDIVEDDSWKGSIHFYTRRMAMMYDTTQNVKEYEPAGYLYKELRCIDPAHVHEWDKGETRPIEELKKLPNFCKYKKAIRELV